MMNFVSRRGFIVGAILLLISNINGAEASRRKREINDGGNNDLDWQAILRDIRKIPLLGPGLSNGLEEFSNTVNKIDELTNGALSNIAGGYPPCVVDLDGIHCNGEAKDGGVIGITEELIKGTGLPDIAKTMIIDFLDAAVFPMLKVIFGIPVSSKKKT